MPFQDYALHRRLSRYEADFRRVAGNVELFPINVAVDLGAQAAGVQGPSVTVQPPLDAAAWIWYGTTTFNHPIEPDTIPLAALKANYLIRVRLNRTNHYLGAHRQRATDPPGRGEWLPIQSVAGMAGTPHLWPYPLTLRPPESVEFIPFNGTDQQLHPLLVLLGYGIYTARPL